LIGKGDLSSATQTYNDMRERGETINPDAVAHLNELLTINNVVGARSLRAFEGGESEPPTVNNLLLNSSDISLQNYPNPFNPATVISYKVPLSSYVTLKIYNMLGQEVATLVNEVQDAGVKVARFDASNFPSGVYFYKLSAGSFTYVKKMLLMK